jgi:predicted enzyme related to lactoylglutathione lyase
MLFKKPGNKTKVVSQAPDQKTTNCMVWLEISAGNLNRAVAFYERMLKIKLEIKFLYDRPTALFNKYETGFNGSIVEAKDHRGGSGIRPVLKVSVMHEALKAVKESGGKVIVEPFILKQKNNNGETVLGSNLIDSQMGYMSEILDSEGNGLLLYSHS